MIKFKCPHCGKEVSAGDEIAGKKGRCPGCKEVFVVPAKAAKPAPSVERRTAPPADDGDDLEVVDEPKARAGSKAVKRPPDEDDYEVVEEAPRKKKAVRDDDDDEAISEAPRKKRLARDDEDDDDRPRKKRGRDEDDEDDEPRSRRKRDREDEDDDDRPRKKRKKRRGVYADCPNCGCRGDASMVGFTWWGGIIGPRMLTHVRCNRCGTCYNGKTGDYNTTKIAIYVGVSWAIALVVFILVFIAEAAK